MTNDNTESFMCDIPDCKISFTSEDSLKWHQKKHKISLKLGLTDKSNESSDQTPTPTRFIRNCEEVGLFQDLQHVNPFDETFKRAIQSKNNTTSHQNLTVPETSNDDTLHTPHIFPPVEGNIEKSSSTKESIDDITLVIDSNDIPISYNNDIPVIQHATSPQSIKVSNVETINNKLKQFIKDKVQNKRKNSGKDNSGSDDDCVIITPVKENGNTSTSQKQLGCPADSATDKLAKQRIRESNRMAQARARIRKKMSQKRMEFQYRALQAENSKLRTENRSLKEELLQLKAMLTKKSTADGKAVNGKNSKTTYAEKLAAPPATISTCEKTISAQPVSTTCVDEAKIAKNVTTSLPLILPKTSNTVFVQTPVLQPTTQVSSCQLPVLLTSQPQLALTVQNPPIQTLSIQNPTIQNPPIQYYVYKI